jgi:orotate phosphoribosyltransferase
MATTFTVSMERAFEIFEIMGALLRNGHFVFTEGGHSADYFNLRVAYAYPRLNAELALGIAERMLEWGVETVVAPPYGAIGLAELVGLHLSVLTGEDVHPVHLIRHENNPKVLLLPPWAKPFIEGKQFAIVEDTASTGGTIKKVVAVATEAGGTALGAASICSRGLTNAAGLGLQVFTSIVEVDYPVWTADECMASQLCAKGVPIRTDVGHGAEFLAAQSSAAAPQSVSSDRERMEREMTGA